LAGLPINLPEAHPTVTPRARARGKRPALYIVEPERNKREREPVEGHQMRHLMLRATMAVTVANIINPVQAQAPSPGAAPPQSPPAAYFSSTYQRYPFPAPTPEDAYREGLINRWQLEQLVGPLPQALQGPSPNGTRGGDGGGDKGG
jgi:hypothetical protein